jgi:hypothetical protein
MAMTLADELRDLANRLETQNRALVSPDMSLKQAVVRLRDSWKRGELSIEMDWDDYSDPVDVTYKFRDKSSYKTVAEEKSLSALVEKLLLANRPNDTLDRLDEMATQAEAKKPKKASA